MYNAYSFYHQVQPDNILGKKEDKEGYPMKNTIRVERAILNITQADLAEKVKVSRQTINAIESNKYVPSTVLALKISRVFHKKLEDIFTLEDTD